MLILIESRSMLIVYWLADQKLINVYLKKNIVQNINLQKDFFWKLKMMYCQRCLYFFIYYNLYTQKISYKYKNQQISIQIYKLGKALNANEVCHWMPIRKCLLAMLMLMLIILMLILILLNLNTIQVMLMLILIYVHVSELCPCTCIIILSLILKFIRFMLFAYNCDQIIWGTWKTDKIYWNTERLYLLSPAPRYINEKQK